jgi:hypothetical protein
MPRGPRSHTTSGLLAVRCAYVGACSARDGRYQVDLLERAGELKGMLVDFAMSPRFDIELTAVIWQRFPGGVISDEAEFTMVLDHFALQHELRSGGTVVEGIFEVRGKDRDAVLLFNFLDELTYRTRSTLGREAFAPLRKNMIVVGRVVRVGDDWVVSGNPAAFPASARDQMLAAAAEAAMRNPAAVFRNPEEAGRGPPPHDRAA